MISLFSLILISQLLNAINGQDVVLRVYTQSNKVTPEIVTAQTNLSLLSGFCSRTECINYVIAHGFNSNGEVTWAITMKDKLLETEANSNVFIVDWRVGANTGINYEQAVQNLGSSVSEVYQILANSKESINYANNTMNIYCIGHSLGSHFCGFTSKRLQTNLNLKFRRITALDPAGPCFEGSAEDQRLSLNDAEYVEAIHTSSILGYNPQIGHSDFYANGGTVQPGCFSVINQIIDSKIQKTSRVKNQARANIKLCDREINFDDVNESLYSSNATTVQRVSRLDFSNIFFICSHGRAIDYFTESITKLSYACKFTSYECSSYINYNLLRCNKCPSDDMGFNSVKPIDGPKKYYVKTNSVSIFCNPAESDLRFSNIKYCSWGVRNNPNQAIIYLSFIFFFAKYLFIY